MIPPFTFAFGLSRDLSTLMRTTCLADKTNHPVKKG